MYIKESVNSLTYRKVQVMSEDAANKLDAEAYAMDIEDVARIRKLYPDQFYEMLNEHFEYRAEMDGRSKAKS